jgi:hypothetical protein
MDISHSALILRFAIGFAMAWPFLIVPTLVSLFKKLPKSENGTEAENGGRRLFVSYIAMHTQAMRPPNVCLSDAAVLSSLRRAA